MNIWEQNIKDWYEKSSTSRLNYLDLASTEKPSSKELAHNISVIYDRVCLLSKVSLKESRHLITENQALKVSLEKIQSKVTKLEKEIVNLILEHIYCLNTPTDLFCIINSFKD